MLLEEFDPVREAVINPDMIYQPVPDFPAHLRRSLPLMPRQCWSLRPRWKLYLRSRPH